MHARRNACRVAGAWALLVSALLVLAADPAIAADDPAQLIGTPASVAIAPAEATLSGRRATRQLIASATYADGSARDLTRALEWVSLNPEIALVSPKGQVVPRGNGTATIVARRGSVEATTTVKVERVDQPAPVSFRRDVIPALSQAGCNMGACTAPPRAREGSGSACAGTCPTRTSSPSAGRPADGGSTRSPPRPAWSSASRWARSPMKGDSA